MQKPLLYKTLVVLGLMVALLLPLGMIQGLVAERSARQREVVADIAASSAEAQRLFGPLLAVPYSEHWQETVQVSLNGNLSNRVENRQENHMVYFLPEQLEIEANLATENKQRGLFKVSSYVLDAQFKGHYVIPAHYGVAAKHGGELVFDKPTVAVAVTDMRGVLDAPGLDWNGKRYAFAQGTALKWLESPGMHAEVEGLATIETAQPVPFQFALKLRGLENLDWVPTGQQTRVSLASTWPHPGFHGRFLPDPSSQQISADGFRASWAVNALASNIAEDLGRCKTTLCFDSFGVRLVDPVNIYSMSERAMKYGFLFVCLTFAAFFLYEVLQRLAIHPAQYTLVGLALAMFFLLLLSLSEHIGFVAAYLLAACACVGLIGYYLSGVMQSLPRAASAGAMLAGLFAVLYGLLQSEDNSLALGSLLLFALLALAMAATRQVDWYQLGRAAE